MTDQRLPNDAYEYDAHPIVINKTEAGQYVINDMHAPSPVRPDTFVVSSFSGNVELAPQDLFTILLDQLRNRNKFKSSRDLSLAVTHMEDALLRYKQVLKSEVDRNLVSPDVVSDAPRLNPLLFNPEDPSLLASYPSSFKIEVDQIPLVKILDPETEDGQPSVETTINEIDFDKLFENWEHTELIRDQLYKEYLRLQSQTTFENTRSVMAMVLTTYIRSGKVNPKLSFVNELFNGTKTLTGVKIDGSKIQIQLIAHTDEIKYGDAIAAYKPLTSSMSYNLRGNITNLTGFYRYTTNEDLRVLVYNELLKFVIKGHLLLKEDVNS